MKISNISTSSSSVLRSPSLCIRLLQHIFRYYHLYIITLLLFINIFSLFKIISLSNQLEHTKYTLSKTLISWNKGLTNSYESVQVENTIQVSNNILPSNTNMKNDNEEMTNKNTSTSQRSTRKPHTLSVPTSPFSYILPWCLPSMPLDTLCRIPIVIYAYNRPEYLEKTLDSIAYAAMNTPYTYVSIFISVDGPDAPALTTALNWKAPPLSSSLQPHNNKNTTTTTSTIPLHPGQAFIHKILVHPIIDKEEQQKYNWNILLLKQHWWWLLQSIFHSIHPSPYKSSSSTNNDQQYNNEKTTNMIYSFPYHTPLAIIPELANYNSDILFLEEDVEITLDSLVTFRALSQLKFQGSINSNKKIIHKSKSKETSTSTSTSSINPSLSPITNLQDIGMVVLSRWATSFSKENPYDYYIEYAHGNLGYGFNYSYWLLLEAHQSHFWSYHDGWDYSLYHLQQLGCLPPAVIGPQIPRLKHIGYEGLTTTKETYFDAGYHQTKLSNLLTMELLQYYYQHEPEIIEHRNDKLHPLHKPCRGCGAGTHMKQENGDTGPTDICKLCHGHRSTECHSDESFASSTM